MQNTQGHLKQHHASARSNWTKPGATAYDPSFDLWVFYSWPVSEHKIKHSHHTMAYIRWFPTKRIASEERCNRTLLFQLWLNAWSISEFLAANLLLNGRLLHFKTLKHMLNWMPVAGCIDSYRDNRMLKDNGEVKCPSGAAEATQQEPRSRCTSLVICAPEPVPRGSRWCYPARAQSWQLRLDCSLLRTHLPACGDCRMLR